MSAAADAAASGSRRRRLAVRQTICLWAPFFLASRAAMPHLAAVRVKYRELIASISGLAGDGGNVAIQRRQARRVVKYDAHGGGRQTGRRARQCDLSRADGHPMTERMRASETVMRNIDRIPLAAGESGRRSLQRALSWPREASLRQRRLTSLVDGGLTAWTGQPVWQPKEK